MCAGYVEPVNFGEIVLPTAHTGVLDISNVITRALRLYWLFDDADPEEIRTCGRNFIEAAHALIRRHLGEDPNATFRFLQGRLLTEKGIATRYLIENPAVLSDRTTAEWSPELSKAEAGRRFGADAKTFEAHQTRYQAERVKGQGKRDKFRIRLDLLTAEDRRQYESETGKIGSQ